MKVHKVTLLIVDSDSVGSDEVLTVLENTRYPNDCIMPRVMVIETAEVEWSDDHPLNRTGTQQEAFEKLFPRSLEEKPSEE